MINRLRPDLLEKGDGEVVEPIVRQDVRRKDDNVHQSAKDILVEKGILRDPTKPTVLLDQFTGTKPVEVEPETDNIVQKVTFGTQTELQGKSIDFR